MEIKGDVRDLRELLFYDILVVIGQVFLLFVLSWNVVAIMGLIILDILLLPAWIVDRLYLSRKIILDECGCTFVSSMGIRKFRWEEIYLHHTKNSSYLYADSEIPGEGIILSVKPISKQMHIGAMTYCKFTHPRTSVFIRFSSSFDRLKRTSGKFVFGGFVADKDKLLGFLKQYHAAVMLSSELKDNCDDHT